MHGNESPAAVVVPAGALAVGDDAPRELALSVASAMPATSGVDLRFALPRPGGVQLAIYDVMGRTVRTLASGELPAGNWTRRWDGSTDTGSRASSGIYFARLDAGGRSLVRRVVLMR